MHIPLHIRSCLTPFMNLNRIPSVSVVILVSDLLLLINSRGRDMGGVKCVGARRNPQVTSL